VVGRSAGIFHCRVPPVGSAAPGQGAKMAYKPAPLASLPPDMRLDATIPEVMAFRHESARTVFRKLRDGVYRSHKNGDTRLIEWASVIEDRNAGIERGPQLAPPAIGKHPPGRPPKHPKTQTPAPPDGTTTRDREHDGGGQ
jgi:hypothetical protein